MAIKKPALKNPIQRARQQVMVSMLRSTQQTGTLASDYSSACADDDRPEFPEPERPPLLEPTNDDPGSDWWPWRPLSESVPAGTATVTTGGGRGDTNPGRHTALGVALLGLVAVGTTGCPNVASLTTARVIQPGTHEITIAPAAYGMSAGLFDSNEKELAYSGTIDFGYRAGVADIVDVGVRLSNFGNVNVDVKVGLVESEHLRLAVDPTLGGVFLSVGGVSAGYMQFDLPVLLDIAPSERFSITIGPRYSMLFFFAGAPGGSTSEAQHLVGSTLGFEFALGNSFAIQPNAGLMFWLNAPSDIDAMFFTAGVAFKFLLGGSRFPAKAQPTAMAY